MRIDELKEYADERGFSVLAYRNIGMYENNVIQVFKYDEQVKYGLEIQYNESYVNEFGKHKYTVGHTLDEKKKHLDIAMKEIEEHIAGYHT